MIFNLCCYTDPSLSTCNRRGPYPIIPERCEFNEMKQCSLDFETNKWFLQIKIFNDTKCKEQVIDEWLIPCLPKLDCHCGWDTKCNNQIIFEPQIGLEECDQAEMYPFHSFVQNECISDRKFIKPLVTYYSKQCSAAPGPGERLEIVATNDELQILIVVDDDGPLKIKRSYVMTGSHDDSDDENLDEMNTVMVQTDPDDENLNITSTEFTHDEFDDSGDSDEEGLGPDLTDAIWLEPDPADEEKYCEWVEEGYDETVKGVILKCDEETQQILLYEYEDNECNGDPQSIEPRLYMDVNEDPCLKIVC